MRFYVVDPIAPGWPTAPVDTEGFAAAPSIASVMWMPFPRSIDPPQLDFFVANAPPFVLRSDVAIIGLHPGSAKKVLETPYILDDVAQRIEGASLLVVHHEDGTPVITHVRGERVEGLESSSTLERIREQDIAEVVRRPGSELPKHHGIHYEGPNGDHYEAFLRPGFAARSIEELDRLAFWLAPMLLRRDSLVVDHWSMISIAYHIGRYSTELGYPSAVRVESLRAYDEDRDVLTRRLKGAFGTIEPESGAVLVSVNSSGRLVRDVLLPAMGDVGFHNPVVIALARSPSQPEHEFPSLTTLNSDFARQEPAECPACTRGNSTLIPIQHDSYLLSLAAYIQTTAITREVTQISTEVIERYGGIGAFRVHRTHSDGRHHAYFVDLMPILERKIFRQRLAETVSPWRETRIDLIVHPAHPAAAQLASMVAEELGATNIVGSNERLQQLPHGEKKALLGAHRICLVDDVVISGARVFGYRNALNAIRRRHGVEECDLYCLVGVSRTASEKALMGVSNMVHHSLSAPRFLSVERFFLPLWNESECRWCAELRILGGLPREIQDRPLIHDRLQALRHPEGLVDNLFLPWTPGQELGPTGSMDTWPTDDPEWADRYWELGPKSVFGEVQGADLAVSVAAAIQRLRGSRKQEDGTWLESDLDEVFHSPLAKVLDPHLYLAGRYYEPVLVASILRASKGHDIRAPGDDFNLQQRVKILAATESSKELHGELILATALNQLPRASYDSPPPAHPDMASLVRALRTSGGI